MSFGEFTPDPFQRQAFEAYVGGSSVVVAAPTGSGKTLVAEAAIDVVLAEGRRAFYTTPLKALSNQKFGDFRERFGRDRVGLLTGDNVVNGDADVVVMTTEVFRNMIYAGSPLSDVALCVLDEVHYLQDRSRGAVWEEVIIHAPPHIRLLALSATVSNAGEFTDWIRSRRGPTELVLEKTRPVPLESLFVARDRSGGGSTVMFDMFVDGRANTDIVRLLTRGRRGRWAGPRRTEVVELLEERQLLPAIYFVFSRAGCEDAARRVVDAGFRFTTAEERDEIRAIAEQKTSAIADKDLRVLAYSQWIDQLSAGVATHHAGLVPAYKETVETAFQAGLIRVVFATETLSLGINMPARTVVLGALSKYNGETHEMLKPGDYTQLTGRAGRRGIDPIGFGIVLHSPYVEFEQAAEIARLGSHPIESSFRTSYNMAVNLVARYERDRAAALLRGSFAEFRKERNRAGLDKAVKAARKRLKRAQRDATCDRGDVAAHQALTEPVTSPRAAARRFLARRSAGDVIDIYTGTKQGRYAVIEKLPKRLLVIAGDGRVTRLSPDDLAGGGAVLGRIELAAPTHTSAARRDIASWLREFTDEHGDAAPVEARVGPQPNGAGTDKADDGVAGCPDLPAHLAALKRVPRLTRDLRRLEGRRQQEAGGLVADLDRTLHVLGELGYVDGWSLTPTGEQLRFLYNELDLVLAECIRAGIFEGVSAPEAAALLSAFVYEPRAEPLTDTWPTKPLGLKGVEIEQLWQEVSAREQEASIPLSRRPEEGFGRLAWRWAQGAGLEELLEGRPLQAGDFVRTVRQLLDLVRQVRDAIPELADLARDILEVCERGVVVSEDPA